MQKYSNSVNFRYNVFMRLFRHLIVFSSLLFAVVVFQKSIAPMTDPQPEIDSQVKGETSPKQEYVDIENSSGTVRVRWFKVEDTSLLSLIANYDKRVPSADLVQSGTCSRVFSGGFYGQDTSPIGLVVSEGNTISEFEKNNTLNGILSINEMGTARITRTIPSGNVINGVQSGPILWENGKKLDLSLGTDKNSRRVVAAITGSNELYFLVFYNPKQVFDGPKLADLSGLILDVDDKVGLNVADAINLDGGSASLYVDGQASLTELSPIGSFWCIK